MAAFYLCARPLFRRVELLNTVALAALVLLFWKPSALADASFQLSFVAAGVIAALALPWIQRTSEPYLHGLGHLGDVTRDGGHAPKIAQFRIELRLAAKWLGQRVPKWLAQRTQRVLAAPARLGLRLWEIILLSFAIQIGMLPLLAADFHRISIAGPISNVPAVALTSLIVPLGFLTLLMTFISARLAALLAKTIAWLTSLLLAVVRWFSVQPHLSYRIPGPPRWLTCLFFATLVLLAASAHRTPQKRNIRARRNGLPDHIRTIEWMATCTLAVLTLLVATYPFRPQNEQGELEINVLDVGQGDSIFAAFPDGRTMLIDGGGLEGSETVGGYRTGTDVGEDVVSPYLWSRGLKRIDVVALTHAHHDHLDGLHSVIENFAVRELWIGRDEETPALRSLLSEARARGVAIVHQKQGNVFDWDGVHGEVLWPPDAGPETEAANDDSLVIRLTDGTRRFLLSGDIEQRVENGGRERAARLGFSKNPSPWKQDIVHGEISESCFAGRCRGVSRSR